MTISKQETLTLEVIQEYLDKNRVLDMENVVSFIRHRFSRKMININDKGIRKILNNLIENKYILPGSKLVKNEILMNPNRRTIYNVIKKNPGIYFTKLLKEVKLSNHVVAWHINILYKFACIMKEKVGNQEIYYHPNINPQKAKRAHYLSKAKVQEILDYFRTSIEKTITKTHLSKALNTHYNTISKYINILEEIGILIKIDMGNKTLYEKIE